MKKPDPISSKNRRPVGSDDCKEQPSKPSSPEAARPAPGRNIPDWILLLGFIAATFVAYQPVWQAGFMWDDDAHLTHNPCIVGPVGFKGIWTSSAATYYPLVLTSLWFQHAIWGLNPLPYHLVNVLVHALGGFLLWKVLNGLRVPGAWLGAALWMLHPVQVESVAWITELKNTQSCVFFLLSIVSFLKWRETVQGRKTNELYYALTLLFAMLAILSKASTVMLPVVIGLCWWWLEGRWNWRHLPRLAPLLLISVAASGWTIWEQQYHSGALGTPWVQSWPERIIISARDVWFYLGKLIWPHPLIFIYPRWSVDSSRVWSYLPVFTLLLAGAFLLWQQLNRWLRPVLFAFAYFVISLFPVMDCFHVYFFRYSFVGDHFQYLASIGPLALAGAGLDRSFEFFGRDSHRWRAAVCAAILLACTALTWKQSHVYRNNETLWQTTAALHPDCWLAQNNLGDICLQQGKADAAMAYFNRAIKIEPEFPESYSQMGMALLQKGQAEAALVPLRRAIDLDPRFTPAHNNLGVAFERLEQPDAAADEFRKSLAINPDDAEALNNLGSLNSQSDPDAASQLLQRAIALDPDFADAYYNLGNACLARGQTAEAIRQFQKALALQPDHNLARNNLGNTLLQAGRVDEAISQFELVLNSEPANLAAQFNLGTALLQKGDLDDAIVRFQNVLTNSPDYPAAEDNLASALFQKGRIPEAIAHFSQIVARHPDDANAHNNLGTALVQTGKLDEATGQFREALKLHPGFPEAWGGLANIAWKLATDPVASHRNGIRAVKLAGEAAAQAGGVNARIDATLAAAYAETGDFPKAIAAAQRALKLANEQGDAGLAAAIQNQLGLYRNSQAVRDAAP